CLIDPVFIVARGAAWKRTMLGSIFGGTRKMPFALLLPAVLLIILTLSNHAMAADAPKAFPKNFKWCVATSAHQIEGNNVQSDWWAFEQIQGHIKNGDKSGAATDHW